MTSAKDLWGKGKELLTENQQIKRSPTGILFRHIKTNKGSILT